jgi:CHAD domain-containing protein
VRTSLPEVASDPHRVEQLHALRKTTKRLRYLHEILGDVDARAIAWTTTLQDLLGDIHDRDVLRDTLLTLPRSPGLREVLVHEREERQQRYAELARWVQGTPELLAVVAAGGAGAGSVRAGSVTAGGGAPSRRRATRRR